MSNDYTIDPGSKARLIRDMTKLRRDMAELGKELERTHGIKDFDPLKNMSRTYPFNMKPTTTTSFKSEFPFNRTSKHRSDDVFDIPFFRHFRMPDNVNDDDNTYTQHRIQTNGGATIEEIIDTTDNINMYKSELYKED